MVKIKDKTKCCGCSACSNICPKNVIDMLEDEKGFRYPAVNQNECTSCDICNKVCPITSNCNSKLEPKSYACMNKDEEVRKQSSSGGVFTLIATDIINKNGVAFGAAFDENFNLKHSYVENIEDLEKFRGSKYLQSHIADMYKKAKEFLDNNRYVLFTGTPCQIEGLNCYLQKEYDKLYTQDIICHGVPSPKVWKRYLEYRKEKDKKTPTRISFRNKDIGWGTFSMKFSYGENNAYREAHRKDIFMKAFLRDVCLRDSCYNCSFKKYNRLSDITLADFWGIDKVMPEMNDNKGTSLAIINTGKGAELFGSIEEKIKSVGVDTKESIKYNKSMIQSVQKNKNREKFFDNLENMDFDKLVGKYAPDPTFIQKCIRKAKRMVKKFV